MATTVVSSPVWCSRRHISQEAAVLLVGGSFRPRSFNSFTPSSPNLVAQAADTGVEHAIADQKEKVIVHKLQFAFFYITPGHDSMLRRNGTTLPRRRKNKDGLSSSTAWAKPMLSPVLPLT